MGNIKVSGFARGTRHLAVGRNDLLSQSLGLYGTYANSSGFCADAVLQAGRHRCAVQPAGNSQSHGKGSSTLASIEVGKTFASKGQNRVKTGVQGSLGVQMSW